MEYQKSRDIAADVGIYELRVVYFDANGQVVESRKVGDSGLASDHHSYYLYGLYVREGGLLRWVADFGTFGSANLAKDLFNNYKSNR
jgi:hypothetical protein